jgi:replicative DNA helicase
LATFVTSAPVFFAPGCLPLDRFALDSPVHGALHERRPVIFFSMEMGYLELTQRILAAEAGINSRLLRTGRLAETDWTNISQAVGRLAEAPLYIDDTPHLTVMEIRAKCRRLKAMHGDLGLMVVGYLQLMSTPKRSENRQVEVSELSRGLKILARDLEVPVMALSQLGRWSTEPTSGRCWPTLEKVARSNRTVTSSASSTATRPTTPIRPTRARPKSSWPSTATARPARSVWLSSST